MPRHDDFSARPLYQDEPIPKRGERDEAAWHCPPQIRAMLDIALRQTLRVPPPRIFYEQARFMADYEDSCPWHGRFAPYLPTYDKMSLAQLRGYFTWRAWVRRGDLVSAPLGFAFVYIYELLHQIGVKSAQEGFQRLKDFWLAYRVFDFSISPFCRMWLRDYALYYGLKPELAEDLPEQNLAASSLRPALLHALLAPEQHHEEALFAALCELGAFSPLRSKLYQKYPEAMRAVSCRAFTAITQDFSQSHPGSCLWCSTHKEAYRPFNGAVFHERETPAAGPRVLSGMRYEYAGGVWFQERFFPFTGKLQPLSRLLKDVDARLRLCLGLKPPRKPQDLPPGWKCRIDEAIASWQAEEKKCLAPQITLDFSRLKAIRAAALATQEKLIVPGGMDTLEEEEAQDEGRSAAQNVTQNITKNASRGDAPALPQRESLTPHLASEKMAERPPAANTEAPLLTTLEARFLRALLSGEPYEALLAAQNLPVSLVVDAVNEKLFDRLNDTAIVFCEGRPTICSEYTQAMRQLLIS